MTGENRTLSTLISDIEIAHAHNPRITLRADVARINQILEQHNLARFRESGVLSELIRADSDVVAAFESRVNPVLELSDALQFTIPKRARKISDSAALEVADYFVENRQSVFDVRMFRAAIEDSLTMGFSVFQVGYRDWLPYVERWHPSQCYYDVDKQCFTLQTTSGERRIFTDNQDPRFVVYSDRYWYPCWTSGRLLSLAPLWMAKRYILRDWGRYGEQYGNPLKLLRIPSLWKPEDVQRVIDSIENTGPDGMIILPRGDTDATTWDLEIVSPSPGTADVFARHLAYIDRSFAVAVLGQATTTNLSGGAYNAVEALYEGVQLGRARSDLQSINQFLIAPLVRSITKTVFGTPDLSPVITIDYDSIARLMRGKEEQNAAV